MKPVAAALFVASTLPSAVYAQSAPPARTEESAKTPETTLPPVVVKDTREGEATGYQGGTTRVGKLPQLPKDIPQSVTIVPRQLIDDRGAGTLHEALRNVAGITFNAGEGGRIGDNFTIRGYSAVGDLYLDGIRDVAQYNREVFDLQQIDVLRGSASMLFGRGSTGGVVNQVSKVPFFTDHAETALTYGSFDYLRATVDLNKKLDEGIALRLNAMVTDTDSFRDEVHQHRWGAAPSLRLFAGANDELSFAYYHLEDDNIPDYGVPYYQGKPLDVPVERFYGLANADYERNRTGISTATYVHRFDADSNVRSVLRHADYDRDLWATAPRLVGTPAAITDSTPVNRQRQARGGHERTLTSQTDYTTTFTALGMDHLALAGVEVAREDAQRWNYANDVANPATTVGNPDPRPFLPDAYFASIRRTAPVSYSGTTLGLYAQDILALTPQWKVLAGVRWDRLDADYDRPPPQGPLSRNDRVWSWRSGLMYQPTDAQTYYAAYGTSFNPSAELYALDDRSQNTPPEKNRNLELGAKWEVQDGDLSLRTAVFRSEKTNERNTDLAIADLFLLSGKRHTDGIELEAAGRITPAWDVFAAVALMRAKIDVASAQQANTQGKTPLNTPDYTASLWTTYRLGEGWRVGGGVEGVAARWGNNANTNEVPGYWRADALVAYEQVRYTVRLNVLNFLDTKYYEGVYQGHVVPGTRRALQLTLELRI